MTFSKEIMVTSSNILHHFITQPSRVREKSTNYSYPSLKICRTRGNQKCARLCMFHPHHRTLTTTSDKHVLRGWKIEKWTNQINTPGEKFRSELFTTIRLNCRLQGLILSFGPPSNTNFMMGQNVLPTTKASSQCEVPIRTHTVQDRIPIRYVG